MSALQGLAPPPDDDWTRDVDLALRFGWTPQQVGQCDPDYLEALQARLEAEQIVIQQQRTLVEWHRT